MSVWLDPRDGSLDLMEFFSPGYAELTVLDSGDVMSTGHGPDRTIVWGAEIKKIGDALQSMQNGRLVEQIGKMHEDYDWKFLIIEGELRCHWATGTLQNKVKRTRNGKTTEFWCDAIFGNKQTIAYRHFMSWVLSLTLCSGTSLIFVTGTREAAEFVMALDQTLSKPWDSHSSLKVFNDSQQPGLFIPSVPMKVARDLAQGLGWEKAAAAADHFQTVRAMANATVEQWREVEGIDRVLAERAVAGVTTPHVLRQRTRRKDNGSTHSDVSKAQGNSETKKRGRTAGQVFGSKRK